MPRQMLKLGTIFNLVLPHTANNNLYVMSRDALLSSRLMRAPIDCMMDMFNIG